MMVMMIQLFQEVAVAVVAVPALVPRESLPMRQIAQYDAASLVGGRQHWSLAVAFPAQLRGPGWSGQVRVWLRRCRHAGRPPVVDLQCRGSERTGWSSSSNVVNHSTRSSVCLLKITTTTQQPSREAAVRHVLYTAQVRRSRRSTFP